LNPTLTESLLQDNLTSLEQEFKAGTTAAVIIKKRIDYIDTVLRKIWQELFGQDRAISLIAVGGYGRGELHPYSDIDLLLFFKT
jgi:[protein-PII] uridylyltransferase